MIDSKESSFEDLGGEIQELGLESIMRENDQLKMKLAKKNKYLEDIQQEYLSLLKTSTQENELLVQKTKELVLLQQKLAETQKLSSLSLGEFTSMHPEDQDSTTKHQPLLNSPKLENITSMDIGISLDEMNQVDLQDDSAEHEYQTDKKEHEIELDQLTKNLQAKEEALQRLLNLPSEQKLDQDIDLVDESS